MANQSRSEHILALAKELLDDIELGRTNAELLLLKTSRLARWVGSDEINSWLKLEMTGYNSTEAISLKYMAITGRWVNQEKNIGYWGPLAQQDASIAAQQAKLAAMRVPDTSGQWANIAIQHVIQKMTECANGISTLSAIRSRVLAKLHAFVSSIYYEKEYDSLSESIFERYKSEIDSLLAENCAGILEKIPNVMSRLADGDGESISQALTTCRRILETFADSIYPPSDATYEIGGNTLKLDSTKHQNRINVYVHERSTSNSRRQKIRQNLSNLFDRVSAGVHSDVTAEEAKSLFLNTYLLLGEILHLGRSVTPLPPASTNESAEL